MNLTKYSGYALFFTGVLHTMIGVILGWPTLLEMHDSGWFSATITNGEMNFKREAITWFLLTGAFWITFGHVLQTMIKQGLKVPLQLGWSFIFLGTITAYIMPVSGAYLFIIQGALIVLNRSKTPQIPTPI
ncbi:hypothetical protein J8L98_07810 [Pseudoalteromonas sp. MMG013]|uniref:DUF6463 family protein n=1 Tax=Pseudoalteromonas sp. MMG013 TaxID=2822687 RepID=UPI001B393535|nr:hypothetical protein [Pseudoalteromonas sp. MMG013]